MKTKFTGYVLAGGKSSRMGADKSLLAIGGETFLERAARTLAPAGEIKIVVNENQKENFERRFPAAKFMLDVFAERGALGGIHAALSDCETEFAVVLAVDLPLVGAETISALINFALSATEFSAVVPRQTDGRFQPLCAVYRSAVCLPVVEKLLSEKSSVSMREFLEKIAVKFVAPKELNAAANSFFNVNQPSDYEKLSSDGF
jgi:molybdenum cofactor guanylyltransferase